MNKTGTNYLQSCIGMFKQYKQLAEKAIYQINDDEIHYKPEPESNSVYTVVKHMSGNMRSRWTDFLTSDGEKEWRNRDVEFEDDARITKAEMLEAWDAGWNCVFHALEPLSEADLKKIVHIRHEPHSVMEAINRQVSHYAYHVGQIVFICKMIRSVSWNTLSIAKGKSQEYNDKMIK